MAYSCNLTTVCEPVFGFRFFQERHLDQMVFLTVMLVLTIKPEGCSCPIVHQSTKDEPYLKARFSTIPSLFSSFVQESQLIIFLRIQKLIQMISCPPRLAL